MTEAKIQNKAVRYARSLGLMVKRNYMGPGAEVGWPDVEVFLPSGRLLLIEFKAPGGALRAMQQYRIGQLRALGHRVEVVDCEQEAKEILDGAVNGVRS